MKRIGVTVGKFMPLHKGHELMIEMAASSLDELVIIVQSNYDFVHGQNRLDSDDRAKLIALKYAQYRNIKVVSHEYNVNDAEKYDKFGTAIDEKFWDIWTEIFHMYCPNATHVVSSDRYGQEMAARLSTRYKKDVEWFPVDPDRELFNISATKIRANPIENWKYISKEFRPFLVKKVVVVGAESSGKSTLVKDLATSFKSLAVPEYGRILSEAKFNNLDLQDFVDIADRHTAIVKKATEETETGLVFVDTERLITFLYYSIYCDSEEPALELLPVGNVADFFDLYVLVEPNIPWVDDGTRVQPDQQEREEFFANLTELLDRFGLQDQVMRLAETNRKKRVALISDEMENRGFFG